MKHYSGDSNPFKKRYDDIRNLYNEFLRQIDWNDFRSFLLNTEKISSTHCKNLLKHSPEFAPLYLTDELVDYPHIRFKQTVLNVISKIASYFDFKYYTEFHDVWIKFLHRKRVHWQYDTNNAQQKFVNYKNWSLPEFLKKCDNLAKLPSTRLKYSIWCKFVLTTGLRPDEAVRAFNDHESLCDGKIMQLFWHRHNKHAHAVYCHPKLHDLISSHKWHISSKSASHYKIVNSHTIGCEIRFLRKVNFSMNCKIDPLLAEFMQGTYSTMRRAKYHLVDMEENYDRWILLWSEL